MHMLTVNYITMVSLKKKPFFCLGHLENTIAAEERKEKKIFLLKIQNNFS